MASPTIDGSVVGSNTGAGSSATVTSAALTTSNSPDLICALAVGVQFGSGATACSSVASAGAGLTLVKLTDASGNLASQGGTVWVNASLWTAPALSTISAQTFTATFASSVKHACIIVFGAKGLYSVTDPFDSNASSTQAVFGDPASPTITFSTDQADDLLIILSGNADSGSPSAPSGWSNPSHVTDTNGNAFFGQASMFTRSVSAKQSGATVVLSQRGVEILFALTADAKSKPLQTFVTCFN